MKRYVSTLGMLASACTLVVCWTMAHHVMSPADRASGGCVPRMSDGEGSSDGHENCTIRHYSTSGGPYELLTSRAINWQHFDPMAYRQFNSDVRLLTDNRLHWHYQMIGVYEGRLYHRVPITLRYLAGSGGLCNQLYSILSVLAIGAALQAEVMVPPQHVRGSFAHQKNWSTVDPRNLLDVDHMALHWRARNVSIIKVTALWF